MNLPKNDGTQRSVEKMRALAVRCLGPKCQKKKKNVIPQNQTFCLEKILEGYAKLKDEHPSLKNKKLEEMLQWNAKFESCNRASKRLSAGCDAPARSAIVVAVKGDGNPKEDPSVPVKVPIKKAKICDKPAEISTAKLETSESEKLNKVEREKQSLQERLHKLEYESNKLRRACEKNEELNDELRDLKEVHKNFEYQKVKLQTKLNEYCNMNHKLNKKYDELVSSKDNEIEALQMQVQKQSYAMLKMREVNISMSDTINKQKRTISEMQIRLPEPELTENEMKGLQQTVRALQVTITDLECKVANLEGKAQPVV